MAISSCVVLLRYFILIIYGTDNTAKCLTNNKQVGHLKIRIIIYNSYSLVLVSSLNLNQFDNLKHLILDGWFANFFA